MDTRNATPARRRFSPFTLLMLVALLSTAPAVRAQSVAMQRLLDGHQLYHDVFGWDTAMNDRYMAISSIYPHQPDPPTLPSGSVRIYRKVGGSWQFWFDLEAPQPGALNVYYGLSIDLSGGMLAVGAPLYDSIGRVFLYDLDSATPAEPVASLVKPDPYVLPPLDGQYFGVSVSIDGSTLIVGSSYEDLTDELQTGSVHVYESTDGVWTHVAQFYPEAIDFADGQYGFSVSLSGDTFVVGAPETDGSTGQADLFQRRNGRWEKIFRFLNFEVNQAVDFGDQFGFSVSVEGDVVVIGAPGDGGMRGSPRAGAVYIYQRRGGSWSRGNYVKLEEPTPGAEHWYGFEVETFDGIVAVGSRYPSSAGPGPGGTPSHAYLYREETTGWEVLEDLHDPMQSYTDAFGWGISLMRNEAVVGAPWYGMPINGIWNNRVGAAYVITPAETAPAWHRVGAAVTSGTDDPCDGFGTGISLNTGTLVISAPVYAGQGAVQTYIRLEGDWMQDATIVPGDGQPGDRFGASMALAGETLIIGSPGRAPDGKTNTGGLRAYRRVQGAWVAGNDPVLVEGAFGLGDVVAATETRVAATARDVSGIGRVHVFDVSEGMLFPQAVLAGEAPEDGFGSAIAMAGDLLAVRAGVKEGIVRVFRDEKGIWREIQQLSGGWASDVALALSADRLVVGETGRVHVFDFDGEGFVETATLYGDGGEHAFGASVAVQGNRIVVGAPGVEEVGAIYVFDKAEKGWTATLLKGKKPASGFRVAIDAGQIVANIAADCFEYGLVEFLNVEAPLAGSIADRSEPARLATTTGPEWALAQNFPNPVRGDTRIGFTMPESRHVTLRLYDALGRQVRVLADGEFPAGAHAIDVDTSALSEGVYYYELRAGNWSATRPMLVR